MPHQVSGTSSLYGCVLHLSLLRLCAVWLTASRTSRIRYVLWNLRRDRLQMDLITGFSMRWICTSQLLGSFHDATSPTTFYPNENSIRWCHKVMFPDGTIHDCSPWKGFAGADIPQQLSTVFVSRWVLLETTTYSTLKNLKRCIEELDDHTDRRFAV